MAEEEVTLTESVEESGIADPMASALGLDEDESDPEITESDEVSTESEESDPTVEETPAEPEPTEPTEPRMVPLAALQESREKLREFRDDPDSLRRRLQELEGEEVPVGKETAREPVKPPEPTRLPEYGKTDESDPDPDTLVSAEEFDYYTPVQVRDHERKRAAWQQRENQRLQQLSLQQTSERVFLDGRRRFTAKAMGADLDYQSVINMGASYLSAADATAIRNSADPAKTSYELCIQRCPGLRAIQLLNGKSGATATSTTVPLSPGKPEKQNPPAQRDETLPSIGQMVIDANDRNAAATVAGLNL